MQTPTSTLKQLSIPNWDPTPDNYPYTGRGFTGSREIILPEYYQSERGFTSGDILKIIEGDTGNTSITFVYDKRLGWLRYE